MVHTPFPAAPEGASDFRAQLASQGYSPRQISVLEGLHDLCADEFDRRLGQMLDELEQQLFQRAEQARSDEVQRSLLAVQRRIHEQRGRLKPGFMAGLRTALASATKEPETPVDSASSGSLLQFSELSLVDTNTMDETVTLKEIATRSETRNSLALFLLGQRLGVVLRSPAFDAENLPLGPRRLCNILREAVACFELESEGRGWVYQQFDRSVLQNLTALLEAINNYLIQQGILPHLVYIAPRSNKRPQRRRETAAKVPETPSDQAEAADAEAMNPGVAPLPNQMPDMSTIPGRGGGMVPPSLSVPGFGAMTPPPRSHAGFAGHADRAGHAGLGAPQAASAPAQGYASSSVAQYGGLFPPISGRPAQPGSETAPAAAFQPEPATSQFEDHQSLPWNPIFAPENGSNGNDVELFDTLRRLLSGRRGLLDRLKPIGDSGHLATPAQVQHSLVEIQRSLNADVASGGAVLPFAEIKRRLMASLRQASPDGAAPQLAAEQGDTMDLVGMLFEQIGQEVRPESTGGHLLARLQLPLLRVALQDQKFFTNHNHAARRLLDVVAETSAYWGNEDEIDRDLVEKMSVLVQRANEETEENPQLFDELVGSLTNHLNTQQRRAEIAERRHIEAARGREKLEIARLQAEEAIEALLESKGVAELVRTLLEEAWIDVLALALLRGGQQAPAFRQHMALAERLVAAARQDAQRQPLEPDEAEGVRSEIEAALIQIGYGQKDTHDIVECLLAVEAAPAPIAPAAPTASPDKATVPPPAAVKPQAGITAEKSPSEPSTPVSEAAVSTPTPAPTELAEKLRNRDRLGQDVGKREARSARKAERAAPLNEAETVWYERLKRLPYGTWFEFTVNQQGDKVRRRMSWFSNVTDHCVFVNLRGQRAGDYTLSWLARELARGNVSLVEAERGTIVDRAWKAIVSTLRSFSRGGDTTPASATA